MKLCCSDLMGGMNVAPLLLPTLPLPLRRLAQPNSLGALRGFISTPALIAAGPWITGARCGAACGWPPASPA